MTTETFKLGSTDVVATGEELNILSGVTSNSTDINKIGGLTNGTVLANKAVTVDANKDVSGFNNISVNTALQFQETQ